VSLTEVSSTRIKGSFFSVAITTPFAAAKQDKKVHLFEEYFRRKTEIMTPCLGYMDYRFNRTNID